ncbi:hypothetical protein KUTeg_014634 [Tegillarca granosa]|uniref:Uncharacterized protein n=1 Tax=Tegillarca granosa TaxID=220873 RepID=A0ABQ9ERJ9_TEGGR|nr:hypothetical protein KUTeg_014634 [Tegillarca granosa]
MLLIFVLCFAAQVLSFEINERTCESVTNSRFEVVRLRCIYRPEPFYSFDGTKSRLALVEKISFDRFSTSSILFIQSGQILSTVEIERDLTLCAQTQTTSTPSEILSGAAEPTTNILVSTEKIPTSTQMKTITLTFNFTTETTSQKVQVIIDGHKLDGLHILNISKYATLLIVYALIRLFAPALQPVEEPIQDVAHPVRQARPRHEPAQNDPIARPRPRPARPQRNRRQPQRFGFD